MGKVQDIKNHHLEVTDAIGKRRSSSSILNQGSPIKLNRSKEDDSMQINKNTNLNTQEGLKELNAEDDDAADDESADKDLAGGLANASHADDEDNSDGIDPIIDSDDDQNVMPNHLQDEEASDIFETDSSANEDDDVQRRL